MSDDERTKELRRLVSGVKPLPPEVRGRFDEALEEVDRKLSAMTFEERREHGRRAFERIKAMASEHRASKEMVRRAHERWAAMSEAEKSELDGGVIAAACQGFADESGFTVTRLPSGRVECVFGEHKVSAGTDVEAVGLMREVLREMECPSGGCGLAARAVADSEKCHRIGLWRVLPDTVPVVEDSPSEEL